MRPEYMFQYIGPVLKITKLDISYIDYPVRISTCSNKNCKNHGEHISCMFNFCTECGKEIKSMNIPVKEELIPSSKDNFFYNKFVLVQKTHFNGVNQYIENCEIPDDVFYYVPILDENNPLFGIFINEEGYNSCINENSCDDYNPPLSYKYCDNCGKKLIKKFNRESFSPFKNKETKNYIKKYCIDNNKDFISLIDDNDLKPFIEKYELSTDYKKAKKIIEKVYGVGSVELVLASVKYHDNY